jgi:hypothetical protein
MISYGNLELVQYALSALAILRRVLQYGADKDFHGS